MSLPDGLRASIEDALGELGLGRSVVDARPVSGGCIHNGTRLETDAGRTLFLKWSPRVPAGMFDAEAEGLSALRAAGALRVPEPLAWRDDTPVGPAWLIMEHVEAGRGGDRSSRALGEGLARLHAAGGAHAAYGWHRDNWIGTLPQRNDRSEEWGVFWRDLRLAPQLERARSVGRLSAAVFDRVLELTPPALALVRDHELLHGDLWSGNAFADASGEPVLVDPAVYVGDGEVDLAMSELFGGFERGFRDAYEGSRGISEQYRSFKRDLYQLYYLLVHVNLFGGAYEAGARAAARTVVAELA